MQTHELQSGGETLRISVFGSPSRRGSVLFCAGRGGSPERHATFLEHLANAGAYVVAPHFDFMASTRVTDEILLERAHRTRLAFETQLAPLASPCLGIGHSLGATLLLAHAGAKAWTQPGAPLPIAQLPLDGLALLAPVLDFFRPPGALDELRNLRAGLSVWVGERDSHIPPSAVEPFRHSLPGGLQFAFARVPDANHFTFMSHPPPGTTETHPDRDTFLKQLASEIADRLQG